MPLSARDAETGRVRRVLQHVRRADARGEPGQPARVRRRARRARQLDINAGDRRARPADEERRSRCCETLADPQHRLRQPVPSRSSRRPPPSRPSPSSRGSCSATSRRRSTPSTRSRVPYLQDTISGGPPALDTAIRSFPDPAPAARERDGLLPGPAAGRGRAARRPAPPLAEAFDGRHDERARAPSPLNHELTLTLQIAPGVRRGPAGALGIHGLRGTRRRARRRRSTTSRARRSTATTSRCCSTTRRASRATATRRPGHVGARSLRCRRRSAPTARSARRPRRRTGRRRLAPTRPPTTCTRTRTRSSARRARTASAWRATRATRSARP